MMSLRDLTIFYLFFNINWSLSKKLRDSSFLDTQILFIFYLFSETKQHKSLKFAWDKNRTSDGKLFTSHCLELNPAHFCYGKDDVLLC